MLVAVHGGEERTGRLVPGKPEEVTPTPYSGCIHRSLLFESFGREVEV